MKKLFLSGTLTLVALSSFAQFTAGNLAVVRVGDGTTALSGLGNNVAIYEYTKTGTFMQAIGIPQTGGTPFSMTGNATAEGALSLSRDGASLTFAGYETARLSSGTLASSTAAAVPRAIGQVSAAGVFSMPVISTTAFSAQSFRGAVTDGANNYWAIGVGQGVTYMGNTASAATIETAQTTLRVENVVGGNIYFTAAGAVYGVTGMPQSGPVTPTAIITTTGTGTGSASSYDFAFNAGMTLAYVADDRTIANGGGIQRWDWNGSAWNLSYTLNPGGTGARGLAVDFATGTIFATTTEASNNRLVAIVDTGASSVSVNLASSGATTAFRGLDFTPSSIPEPATGALAGLGALVMMLIRRRK